VTAQFSPPGAGIEQLAQQYGTPLFVYDGNDLADRLTGLRQRLHPSMDIFFSLKANPNVSICALLHAHGACAEVSSMAELLTARRAGVSPEDIIFLGPGKSQSEIEACLDGGIYAVVCESLSELALIDHLAAAHGLIAPVALRVNPTFAVKGSGLTMGGKPRQFGIDEEQLVADPGLANRYPSVRLMGVQVYMGTRILDEEPIVENTRRIFAVAEHLSRRLGFPLDLVDVGGGLGVAYFEGERDLDVDLLTTRLNPVIEEFAGRHPGARLVMELGRYLTARSGTYVVRVRYVKTSMGQNFAVTDGGTNHHMAAVGVGSAVKRNFPMCLLNRIDEPATESWHVTGPLCTPNDTLGRRVALPPVQPGDLIGIARSGAYGPTASPVLFLSHGYPAEVMVHDGLSYLISERDQPADLLRRQHLHHVAGLTRRGRSVETRR
jgi:diaminopimelate decarboxylase